MRGEAGRGGGGGGASGAALGGQWRCSQACQRASRSPLFPPVSLPPQPAAPLPHHHPYPHPSSSLILTLSLYVFGLTRWGPLQRRRRREGGRGGWRVGGWATQTGNKPFSPQTSTGEVEVSTKLWLVFNRCSRWRRSSQESNLNVTITRESCQLQQKTRSK